MEYLRFYDLKYLLSETWVTLVLQSVDEGICVKSISCFIKITSSESPDSFFTALFGLKDIFTMDLQT